MTGDTKPTLKPVRVADLRPTQITVGLREVAIKRHALRALAASDAGEFLGHHIIPVMVGPKGRNHIVDHHHLARALHEEGMREVFVSVVADLSMLD